MRAEKRVVNAKKELVKLKQIAGRLHAEKQVDLASSSIPDVVMKEPGELSRAGDNSTPVSIDKTKMNQWQNQRRIKKVKRSIKKKQKARTRGGGGGSSAGIRSRRARKTIKK